MTSDKKFTWNELKKIVNEMPETLLGNPVIGWPMDDEEKGIRICEVMELKEDHVFDGDEGCMPISVAKENYYDQDENYLVHPKGTKILIYR